VLVMGGARYLAAAAAILLTALAPTPAVAQMSGGATPPGRFELLGHDPLMNRGMNAALAVKGHYAYVGYRSDGTHLNAGVMVVDVANPAKPSVVTQIGQPNEANIGESSRELRILPQQNLLLVLNHGCNELIHRCLNLANAGVTIADANVRFYDIAGANAANPKLVATYVPPVHTEPQTPHEFFVWSDPQRPGRVLLYMTTPGDASELYVTDISRARENKFTELTDWRAEIENAPGDDVRLHSLTVSHDGKRAYLAYLGGGFLVADTSDLAADRPKPEIRQITPGENRVHWGNPGAHSAVQVPGRPDWAMTTDEVYGKLGGLFPEHGCPWGWVRFIDIHDPAKPRVASEFKLPYNDPATCAALGPDRDNLSSFASHNPTLTPDLAFVTWHSGGFQAIDIANTEKPTQAAEFMPEPLPIVDTEDPALSSGRDKVVMWSYPVIQDGLIYVVDLRNGLYILRYHGPHEEEVARVSFLDGNTNSGDIGRFETGNATAGTTAAPACLAAPLKLGAKKLGPFTLGQTREKALLRAGPALRTKGRTATWCVGKKGKATVVFSKAGKVVLAVATQLKAKTPVSAARVTKNVRRSGSRLYVKRAGKLAAAGVTSLRSRASIVSALRTAGLG
jgi:hypothetical protein